MKYRARTLAGATKRVNELEAHLRHVDELAQKYRAERNLLAMLAAKTPQFFNPLDAARASTIRDEILAGRR